MLALSLVLGDVTLFGTFACGVQRILFASSYDSEGFGVMCLLRATRFGG